MLLNCRDTMVPVPTSEEDFGIDSVAFSCEVGIENARWLSVSPERRNVSGQSHSAIACGRAGNSVIVLHLIVEDEDGVEEGGGGEKKGGEA
jgi:hypothetical protein